MLLLLNLAVPWLLLGAASYFAHWLADPQLWILQGLHPQLSLYGIPTFAHHMGLIGLMIPLAVLHNVAFLFVRLIQSRIDLEFLPMIRSWLLGLGGGLLAYWLWISFLRGAKFGELHTLVLLCVPVLAVLTGLATFVGNNKGRGPAQLAALFVALAPYLSIASSLTGNRLRPQSFFSEVTVEPGGSAQGWDRLDSKTRNEGYLRLAVDKEGKSVLFPSLARDLKIKTDAQKRVQFVEGRLDAISLKKLMAFPEALESAGWRALGPNAEELAKFCSQAHANSPHRRSLEWTQADALLTLSIERCSARQATWSMSAKTWLVPLGSLDAARAAELKQQRETSQLTLKQVDQALLSDKDWRQRKLGLGLLARVNDVAAIPLLAHGFYDLDVEVRRAAALGLLSWGSKAQDFLTRALNDPNPYMRGDALKIVAFAQRHTPNPAAIKLLDDPSSYVRVSAVQALAPLAKDNEVLKTLMRTFDKEYEKVDPAKSEALLEDPFVAELVIAISRAQDVRTAPMLLKAMSKTLSVPGANDQRAKAEAEAAHALRGMKNWLGVDYLQAIVKRSPNLSNREKALAIMARWREPGDEAAYVKAIRDPDLQPQVLRLASAFKSDAVYQELIDLVASADEVPVLEPVATELAKYRRPASITALVNRARTLDKDDPKKLESIAHGLGLMWDLSLPQLKSMSTDTNAELRLVAVLAAKYGQGPGREPILKTASKDKDPVVAAHAKEILKSVRAKGI
jgi:hypothetical protein